jgi:2-methylcitrate dehydratase
VEKFKVNLARIYGKEQQDQILALSLDYEKLAKTSVSDYMDLLAKR